MHKPAGQPGEGISYWPPPEINQRLSQKVGNLGLTDAEEDQIVQFLTTLTDGYFVPPARPEGQPVPSAALHDKKVEKGRVRHPEFAARLWSLNEQLTGVAAS